jgi:hypothetical protein
MTPALEPVKNMAMKHAKKAENSILVLRPGFRID